EIVCARGLPKPEHAGAPLGTVGGLSLILRTRYLLLIGLMAACSNVVNTHGEYMLSRAVLLQAEKLAAATMSAEEKVGHPRSGASLRDLRRKIVGRLYADFYGTVNIIAFLLQCLVVSRVLKLLGVRRA